MAWRKRTNTHMCPVFGPRQLKSLIVRLADFVLIYIRISIDLQSTKCWDFTWAFLGLRYQLWKLDHLKGGNSFHAWKKYDFKIWGIFRKGKKKKSMSLEIHIIRQHLTVILFAATHIWPIQCLLPPLPGLFYIRKKTKIIRVQKWYFIVLLSSPMANGL